MHQINLSLGKFDDDNIFPANQSYGKSLYISNFMLLLTYLFTITSTILIQ